MSASAEDRTDDQTLNEEIDAATETEPQVASACPDSGDAPADQPQAVEDALAEYAADEVAQLREEVAAAGDRALRAQAELPRLGASIGSLNRLDRCAARRRSTYAQSANCEC